jgi:hypothetical protein
MKPPTNIPDKELVARLRQILPGILAGTPVVLAYLYGSNALGQARPDSDVDIALVLGQPQDSPTMPPKARLNLEFAVEVALEQHDIPRPDVRVIDVLPLTFRGQVAIQGVRLYWRDEVARVEFETRTWKEYLDFEPVRRMMHEALIEHVRHHSLYKR